MTNRASSFPTPPAPPPMVRYGGRISSADELPITGWGNDYVVEGSALITRLPATHSGTLVFLRFTGTPTFVNSPHLICQGGANIVIAAGDVAWVSSDGSGVWRVYVSRAANVGAFLAAADLPSARTAIAAAPFDALAYNGMQFNGGIDINQESTTVSLTLTATSSLQTKYLVDGVMADYRGTFVAVAGSNSTPFTGGRKALQVTVSTAQASLGANDELSIRIPFEGVRVARLGLGAIGAAPQALGFWFYSANGGTYSGSIRNAGKTRSYPFSFVAPAVTLKWVSLSNALGADGPAIPGDTSGTWGTDFGVGMYVTICIAGGVNRLSTASVWTGSDVSGVNGSTNGAAATSNLFYISNIISLPGIELPTSDRAAFIMRPFDQELALAQRYYFKTFNYGTTPVQNVGLNTNEFEFPSSAAASAATRIPFTYPHRMRAVPSLAFFSPGAATGNVYDETIGVECGAPGLVDAGESRMRFNVAVHASTSVGNSLGVHIVGNARFT